MDAEDSAAGDDFVDMDGGLLSFIPDGSTIPDEVWQSRHRYFVITVLAHIPVLLALGLLEGPESAVTGMTFPSIPLGTLMLELGIIAALALAATAPQIDRRVRTVLAVTGLAFCSGTLVHVSGGYIEAHFHFFVAVGVVAVYEDWLPFGIGIGYVVLTHGLFGMVDPSRVYNHTAAQMNPWVWGLIHGGFVAMLAVALTVHLSGIEKTRQQIQHQLGQARERATAIDNLEERQEEIAAEKEEAERLTAEAEEKLAEVEAMNDHFEQKATEYQAVMERAASGDLTARVDPESESQGMTAIGESFNTMLDDIEATVGDIQSFAEDVQGRMDDVDRGTQQAATASGDVSESVQGIAAGADEQRQMLDEVANEMSDFSATIEEVAASAQEVAQASDETTDLAGRGQALADEMTSDAEQVQASIEDSVETVAELEDQMATIEEITDLIADIAEQTNMLALNASIEAARAGGDGASGEGFEVVASEVKQLAGETQASAEEIQAQIAATQEKTETVVAEVSRARELMQREIEAVEKVVEAFEAVADNAEQTNSGIQEISESTDSQAASSEEVVSMVDQVTEISNESADEAESVSAAVEEQTASMNEVSDTASTISARTDELMELLSTFTVSRDRPAADQSPTVSSPKAGDM